MDKFRPGRVETFKVKTFQQGQLLQHHRTLAPDAGFANRVTAVVISERLLNMRLPMRQVRAGKHAAVTLAGNVHNILCPAKSVDRLGNKTLRPNVSGAFDLLDAIGARTFSLA